MLELASLTADQLLALPRETSVIFFTVGSLEDHGPHLPIGLDVLEAHALARRAAHKIETTLTGWTVLHYPLAPLAVETNTSKLAVQVRGHVLRDYLVDVCESFYRAGFSKFVCFSGHAGPHQLTAIEEAGKIFRKNHAGWFGWKRRRAPSLVSANSVLLDPAETTSFPLWSNPPEHGGARDTSVALAIGATVGPEYRTLPERPREGSAFERFLSLKKGSLSGYWGNPARASAEQGERVLSEKLETLIPKLRAVWEGENGTHVFKSWFSIYPTNWSLFRVWLLVTVLIIILAAWVMVSFQAMFTGIEY